MRELQAARGTALSEQEPEQPVLPARRVGLLAVVAVLGYLADVATKVAVVAELEGRRTVELGPLTLRVSRNPGAAFSFAEGYTVVFTAVAVLVVLVIARTATRLRSVGWAISLGLLLAGALGNLTDRLLRSPGVGRGAVVDFLDLGWWPSFNVADSCICVGGALAVLMSARGRDIDGSRERETA